MTQTIELPLWLVVLTLILAAIAALERVLMPSARWFLRRWAERLVARLNTRLARPIQPFRLMARQDRVVQLTYDPQVIKAVMEEAQASGTPEPVVFDAARKAAREIVPGFSAVVYFSIATRLARWLSQALYKVRVGRVDTALAGIDRQATVVFVMNHRSNMDYVLVTWLVADRSALSYAVGEWARVWPLSAMIRAMGAFFVRRNSRDTLYRKVLARYVQTITAEGVTQAVFPEGGLSLNGQVGAARMGLLSYILQGFGPGHRDVVFVPVGISYDRVLEDRVLVAAAQKGERKFRAGFWGIAVFVFRMIRCKIRGTWKGFGMAAVAFGAPLSLGDWLGSHPPDPEALGADLMARVAKAVPVLPVPLVAAAIRQGGTGDLTLRVLALAAQVEAAGGSVEWPQPELDAAILHATELLQVRGLVTADLTPAPGQEAMLAFQAGPVEQVITNSLS